MWKHNRLRSIFRMNGIVGMRLVRLSNMVNSLAPGRFQWTFIYVIFKFILVTDGWDISCEIALLWMSMGLTDDKSTLVQVLAWCRQATSHYLSQCWSRSMALCGVSRPWLVDRNISAPYTVTNKSSVWGHGGYICKPRKTIVRYSLQDFPLKHPQEKIALG